MVQELLGSLLAEFGSRSMVDQCGKACRAQWDFQNDAVITAQKDVRQQFRTARKRRDPKPLSIERLVWIGDLDPLRASVSFVVEVGIKKLRRSTVSRMPS